MRQKTYKVGKKTIKGVNECYIIQNPRDWKKTPARTGEAQRQKIFQEASARKKADLADETKRAEWEKKLEEQIEHPKGGKTYSRLDNYVQAMYIYQLSQATEAEQA